MSSYCYVCVRILLCMCPHATVCVLILLYMCPHSCVLMLLYVSSYCFMCPHTAMYVSSCYCMCPHATVCVLILLYLFLVWPPICQDTFIVVWGLILLNMCPCITHVTTGQAFFLLLLCQPPQNDDAHTLVPCGRLLAWRYAVAILYMCPHLLHMCPHTTTCVSSY